VTAPFCADAFEVFKAFRNPALVIGHPGHELKVLGWISAYQPRAYVLTDGSGRGGHSRLPSTARLFEQLSVETDDVFGATSDANLYRAILAGQMSSCLTILDSIIESFIENDVDVVAADAMEGFNPAHDICRALVDAAVLAVSITTGRTIANYRFCLTEWERSGRERHDEACSHLTLGDAALRRKIEAAQGYVELKEEVRAALALRGEEYFRVECLKKVSQPFQACEYSGRPGYEGWGEQRVSEGAYEAVIRYDQHVQPMVDSIRAHALRTGVRANRAAVAESPSLAK
jgi:hypothetical protein